MRLITAFSGGKDFKEKFRCIWSKTVWYCCYRT